MEPTSPNANTDLKTNAQTAFYTLNLEGDTLVERSCGTLSCDTLVTLWDTLAGDSCSATLLLVGHPRTALTYSDVIWQHKLTVLKPQLPEAASRTTCALQSCEFYSSQKLLAALHLYYPVVSSKTTALRSYICTTKWTVLRPHLPEAASRTTFVLRNALHVYYKLPVLRPPSS